MENWSPAGNFGPNMDQFPMEFWSRNQFSMEFCSYSYKNVEEHFTITQTMTKISLKSLRRGEFICSRRGKIVGGDQSRHGSNQKPWRGDQNFSGGPIL